MCGLAGYNISPGVCQEYIANKPGVQKDLLRQAWLHNLHRGWDAAGYVGTAVGDQRTHYYKRSGDAIASLVDAVDKDEFIMPDMYVMAAHTRAATGGSPLDLGNNHPVSWDGVHVTHNGVLTNHHQLRMQFLSQEDRDNFPEVDSAVIPVVLKHHMSGPLDTEGLVKACRDIKGSFSFHAVWSDFPGISVFVRGTGRPLIFAELTNSMLVYGSEEDSVWAIINRMGIDPNKKFEWWELDQEKFLVVDAGKIVKWGSFKTVTNNNSRAQQTRRYLPREDGGKNSRKRQLIYETDSDFDFANKVEHKSLLEHQEETYLVYTREDGFVDSRKFPMKSDSVPASVCSEADAVYLVDKHLHAFYGGVEIVMNENRTVQDIYNHDLFSNGQRWNVKKNKWEPNKVTGSSLTLNDFIRLHTTTIGKVHIPSKMPAYKYIADLEKAKKAEEDKKSGPKRVPPQLPLPNRNLQMPKQKKPGPGTNNTGEVISDDDETWVPTIMVPNVKLSWANFYERTYEHAIEAGMFFLQERICPTHKQLFHEHDDPGDCIITLNAASFAMAACTTIELYRVYDPSIPIVTNKSSNFCGYVEKKCDYIPIEAQEIKTSKTSWRVTVSELCTQCDTFRTLDPTPMWWELLTLGDRFAIGETVDAC